MSVSLRPRTVLSRATFVIVLGSGLGCGGAAPPPVATTPANPAPTARREANPDLSNVPEPAGLVAVGRIGKPDKILHTVGSWTGLPLPRGNDLVRSITDDAIGEAVDLSQPVDGAVVLAGTRSSPKPLYAFSVAVRSFDDAKEKLSTKHGLAPSTNGALEIKGIGKSGAIGGDGRDGDDDDDDDISCVLAPASKGARIVCGDPAGLESLVPYLTRTLPQRSFASDVHVELRFGPVKGPVSDLRAQLPILARGLLGSQGQAVRDIVDAAIGEIGDFVGDASKLSLDADIAETGVNTTMRIDYGSAKSVIAQLAASNAGRAATPPAAFWHLPQDTDVAFFGQGSDPKLLAHPRELLANLLLETFTEGGLPEAERKTIKDLVVERTMPLFVGPIVYAKGYDAGGVEKAMAAYKTAKGGDLASRERLESALGEQILGWHLVRVDQPIANVGPILKDWSTLWARPGFQTWAKKQASAKMMARLRTAPVPAGVTLPKDTVHLELTIPRDDLVEPGATPKTSKKVARKAEVVHVFAVPDSGATWLAIGLDPKLVGHQAAAALSSAPDASTIGKAKGFEALHDASKVNGGLAFTLRGLLVFTAMGKSDSPFAHVGFLPNKGSTPAIMTFSALGPTQDADAKAGAASATLRIPRGVIEDVVRLAMAVH